MLGDRVAMSGSGQQSANDEQVERALQEPNPGWHVTTYHVEILRQGCVERLLTTDHSKIEPLPTRATVPSEESGYGAPAPFASFDPL